MAGDQYQANNEDPATPFWHRIFMPGSFEWSFKMRKGDAESFFAPTDKSADILAQRQSKLNDYPERYLAVTPTGEKFVDKVWDLALSWGHVSEPDSGIRDLVSLSQQWEADLLIMDQETLSFVAGAVCFPSSWNLRKRIGHTIHEVHEAVPDLNPQIGEMITSFLSRLRPGKSSRRENWSFTRSPDLDYHPELGRQALDESVGLDDLWLRAEHQLFLGIPDGVLMGLRIEAIPLTKLATDPVVWRAVAEKIQTMPHEVADYKSMTSAIPRILSEMDSYSPLSAEGNQI